MTHSDTPEEMSMRRFGHHEETLDQHAAHARGVQRILMAPTRDWIIIGVILVGWGILSVVRTFQIPFLILTIVGALPTLWDAARDLRRTRKITINSFNSVALLGAFLATSAESAAFIVLMLTSARLLEWRTQRRTERAIEAMLTLRPKTAQLSRPSGVVEVSIGKVRRGDHVVVSQGGSIPVDGVIISGAALIDESSVTGESIPLHRARGDHVMSGTSITTGAVTFRAERVGRNSTVERLILLLKQAQANASTPEKIADRFARWFLPIVLLLAVGVGLANHAVTAAIAILLVACADDMAVAIPLAMSASIGAAARRGIIVKGGAVFDTLRQVKTMVFDKTGTLTYGQFIVSEIRIFDHHISEKKLWTMVGMAEKFSEHPVGRSILREAQSRVMHIPDPDSVRVVAGAGIIATQKGSTVAVGGPELLKVMHITPTKQQKEQLRAWGTSVGRGVFVVIYGKAIVGMMVFRDQPRTEARAVIHQLRTLGIQRIVMLTGDAAPIAQQIAEGLGISEVHAELTPQDKVRIIKTLKQQGPIAMVGDGINDAPALALAEVGIAMGKHGAAVTVEAADVVILNDDLRRLPEAVHLAQRTMRTISLDILIWVVSNLLGFGLVFLRLIGPELAAAYNFVTDFFPLLNSARLFKYHRVISGK